jgi:hypothetical protein
VWALHRLLPPGTASAMESPSLFPPSARPPEDWDIRLPKAWPQASHSHTISSSCGVMVTLLVLRKNCTLTFSQMISEGTQDLLPSVEPRHSTALDVGTLSGDNRQGRSLIPQGEVLAMPCFTRLIRQLGQLTCALLTLLGDGVRCFMLRLRSPEALAAENLFLRKQLAPYQERQVKPKRAGPTTRIALSAGRGPVGRRRHRTVRRRGSGRLEPPCHGTRPRAQRPSTPWKTV